MTFTCEIMHQKHLAQSGRNTRSAVDIFNTLRVFTKEPIREQEIKLECMNANQRAKPYPKLKLWSQIYKGDPRPRIPLVQWHSQPQGPNLGVFRFLQTAHAKTNAKQMCPQYSHTVQRFTHVYLYAQTAADAGDICTWRTTVILIAGKTEDPQFEFHGGIKMGQVQESHLYISAMLTELVEKRLISLTTQVKCNTVVNGTLNFVIVVGPVPRVIGDDPRRFSKGGQIRKFKSICMQGSCKK